MKYVFQKLTGVPYRPMDKDFPYYWYNPETLYVRTYTTPKDAWRGAFSAHRLDLSACCPVLSVVLVLGPDNAYLFPGRNSPSSLSGKEFGLSNKAMRVVEDRFGTAEALFWYIFKSASAEATRWKDLQDLDEITLNQLFWYAVRYGGDAPNFWDRTERVLGVR